MTDYSLGCQMPVEDWLWLNRTGIFENPALRVHVAPFPPPALFHWVSGLDNERDFASHGADLFLAMSQAAPKPLAEYRNLLDFGCGCGRFGRMLKGHPYNLRGCDIDAQQVEWMQQNVDFMKASCSQDHPPLPYTDNQFDAVVSISVFTHLNEASQDQFLADLNRVTQPGAHLFLTVHGLRALQRARQDEKVWQMISVNRERFDTASELFAQGKHAFVLQHERSRTSLASPPSFWKRLIGRTQQEVGASFAYGMTFHPESYIRSHWSRWFTVLDYRHAAIHDFQDIVVLTPKKRKVSL